MGTVATGNRMFLCGHCGELVQICPSCDRGNVYCSRECAAARRRESVRQAAKRYQQTRRGAQNVSFRQACVNLVPSPSIVVARRPHHRRGALDEQEDSSTTAAPEACAGAV